MKERVTLLVEVDLAPDGYLSTTNHWREALQAKLDDFAGTFRPYVRGETRHDDRSSGGTVR